MKEKYLAKQRNLSQISIRPEFPKIIKIDTCNICNYHCLFCPNAIQSNKVGNIDDELCRKIIIDAYGAGAREICVSSTGEPLLNKKLEEYIRLAKSIGYNYVFLNTNGYFMTEDRSVSLLESGVDSIKISVNAGRKSYKIVHGIDAYDKVLENVKKISELNEKMGGHCKLSVSFVALKSTIAEFDEVREDFRPYVDDVFCMNANSRGGCVEEIVQQLYLGIDEFSYKFPCSQLFNNVYVTAEGYMSICCQDFDNLTVVADLHEESVADAWNNANFTAFREKYLAKNLKGTLCQNCINGTNEDVLPLCPEKAHYKICDALRKDVNTRVELL